MNTEDIVQRISEETTAALTHLLREKVTPNDNYEIIYFDRSQLAESIVYHMYIRNRSGAVDEFSYYRIVYHQDQQTHELHHFHQISAEHFIEFIKSYRTQQ
jgi:hypothetical protein